jgi:hypothetical protein
VEQTPEVIAWYSRAMLFQSLGMDVKPTELVYELEREIFYSTTQPLLHSPTPPRHVLLCHIAANL